MIDRYLIFQPESQGSVIEEFAQCLKKISDIMIPDEYPVKLNIFIGLNEFHEFVEASQVIRIMIINHFNDLCPAFNITFQPPEQPWKVAVEAGCINSALYDLESKEYHSIPYIIATINSIKEVWAGGLGSGLHYGDTRRAANAAFNQMRGILKAEHMTLDHVVRQWNFIGNILEVKNEIQNYQVFNEVRSENYHKYRSIHSYPSATGIGMKHGGVSIDFCAVDAENNLKTIAIDNPDQIRPYDYSQKVLKGKPTGGKRIKQPPQFERALFLTGNNISTLFISGTASIIGQDTIGIDDIEKQTKVTIENISKLSDETRLRHLTGINDPNELKLILLRVYIKKQDDFDRVKAICSDFFPGVTAIFIEADICRNNLLVEIEGEFSKSNK
jgi:enamine deaminase RidA (YjgF/YER057c/UK114 family)